MCFCEYFFLMLSFIAYLNGLFILKSKTIEICQCVYACINNDDNNGNIDVLVGVTTIDDCWIYKFYYSCHVFQFFIRFLFSRIFVFFPILDFDNISSTFGGNYHLFVTVGRNKTDFLLHLSTKEVQCYIQTKRSNF